MHINTMIRLCRICNPPFLHIVELRSPSDCHFTSAMHCNSSIELAMAAYLLEHIFLLTLKQVQINRHVWPLNIKKNCGTNWYTMKTHLYLCLYLIQRQQRALFVMFTLIFLFLWFHNTSSMPVCIEYNCILICRWSLELRNPQIHKSTKFSSMKIYSTYDRPEEFCVARY